MNIWGTYDSRIISTWLDNLGQSNENLRGISYTEFSSTDFNQEVLEALAEGRAPDLLLLDNTQLYEQYDRILQLTSNTISQAEFRDIYLEIAELYFTDEGVLGLPLIVDPIVMFWNRSLFSSAGEVAPPVVWQDFFRLVPTFTQASDNFVITQTALPFGEAVNVTNMKEILATLALQSGNPVTVATQDGYQSAVVGIRI